MQHNLADNPVDVLESLFAANDWPFFRNGEHEITIEAEGGWCDRHIHFLWQETQHCLYFTCRMTNPIKKSYRSRLDSLLARINAQLWMGHFELSPDDGCPTFRHCLPLRGMGSVSHEVIEDLLNVAIGECERFYPAFQMVLWGKYDCDAALQTALLDCRGEA